MIDIRKLKELVRLMVENDLSEIDLRDQEEKVTIKRGSDDAPVVHHTPAPAAPAAQPAAEPAPAEAPAQANPNEGLIEIASPMVGSFYSAANPDAEPFVTVGASVSPATTVCLIEAMKVFNEIKAECAGTIERVLVENGQAVEFGQTLYLVKPA